ncbi:MAG: TIGR02757 family protein [Actinomycetota bacterium]|nr:TIGR02757 family protein [Actinomycetota bacterium]
MGIPEELENIYSHYNDIKYVHPDPLEFLYDYKDLKDREIVGLISALLAYGRVAQILKSITSILKVMEKPYDFLVYFNENDLKGLFKGFVHRFTTEYEIILLLVALKRIIGRYETIGQCFSSIYDDNEVNIFNSLNRFIKIIGNEISNDYNSLVSKPDGSSAYKRFNLFLRWMVRKDNVDPGGWDFIQKSKLLIPLDTHMYRICCKLDFTKRKQAGIKTVIEITDCFKKINPEDPVKYDFALTRISMHDREKLNLLFNNCKM